MKHLSYLVILCSALALEGYSQGLRQESIQPVIGDPVMTGKRASKTKMSPRDMEAQTAAASSNNGGDIAQGALDIVSNAGKAGNMVGKTLSPVGGALGRIVGQEAAAAAIMNGKIKVEEPRTGKTNHKSMRNNISSENFAASEKNRFARAFESNQHYGAIQNAKDRAEANKASLQRIADNTNRDRQGSNSFGFGNSNSGSDRNTDRDRQSSLSSGSKKFSGGGGADSGQVGNKSSGVSGKSSSSGSGGGGADSGQAGNKSSSSSRGGSVGPR